MFLADVTEENEVAMLVEAVQARLGSPQILINNAGTNLRKNLVDFTLEEFQSVLDASLISTFLMWRAFYPRDEGQRIGPHSEHDLDYEPRFTSWTSRL